MLKGLFEKLRGEKIEKPASKTEQLVPKLADDKSGYIFDFLDTKEFVRYWIDALEQELLKPIGSRNKLVIGNSFFALSFYLTGTDIVSSIYNRWYIYVSINNRNSPDVTMIDQDMRDQFEYKDFTNNPQTNVIYVVGASGNIRVIFSLENNQLRIINVDYYPPEKLERLHQVGIKCSPRCNHINT